MREETRFSISAQTIWTKFIFLFVPCTPSVALSLENQKLIDLHLTNSQGETTTSQTSPQEFCYIDDKYKPSSGKNAALHVYVYDTLHNNSITRVAGKVIRLTEC